MYALNRERGPWQTEADSGVRGKGGEPRPLVVVVEPRGVRLRPKGCRSGEFFINWGTIYLRGAAANAGFDTAPTGKGVTKRKATIALVQQLYDALNAARYAGETGGALAGISAHNAIDAAMDLAEKSGLVKFTLRRAIVSTIPKGAK